MKKERGITLISLVIYIIGMLLVMGIVGTALSFYNKNVIKMNDISEVNIELNKLENQMITETQTPGNYITQVTDTTITFDSGNIYVFADNKIYQNAIQTCNYVDSFLASLETDGDKQILRIHIKFVKRGVTITKNLSYVVGRNNQE